MPAFPAIRRFQRKQRMQSDTYRTAESPDPFQAAHITSGLKGSKGKTFPGVEFLFQTGCGQNSVILCDHTSTARTFRNRLSRKTSIGNTSN